MEEDITQQSIIINEAISLGFTPEDFAYINNSGSTIEEVVSQINIFKNGISKIVLDKPATLNDGIFSLSRNSAAKYASYFEDKKDKFILKKFVPASGAASRMFKFLSEFLLEYNPDKESINAYINRKNNNCLYTFLVALDKFPFYKDVITILKEKNSDYNLWNKDEKAYNFVKIMLCKENFNFAEKPKGILPFHSYDNFIATPIFEHLKESVAYAEFKGRTNIHFTISENHLKEFNDCIEGAKKIIEKETNTSINYSFSYQYKETNTIAVDSTDQPFRDNNGNILFRPGGHGALIKNLNNLDADIVFIKNIDNVSHNNIDTIALYKRALAGILIELQEKIFYYLYKLDHETITDDDITEVLSFAKKDLLIDIPTEISKYTSDNKIEYLKQVLDRPIRICGMVKNEGEPGGGPFWARGEKGKTSLQIVESSQIDLDNKAQSKIFSQSTHFNPVDVVCSFKNYKGEKYDLTNFVDHKTGFIVEKTWLGKKLKSYELPGLWNGAMAEWISIFVEVPLDTFSPVKNVNDLLKPAHQPQ